MSPRQAGTRGGKIAQFVIALLVFGTIGVGGTLALALSGEPITVWGSWLLIWGIVVVALLYGFVGYLRETRELDPGTLQVIRSVGRPPPPAATKGGPPWPFEELAQQLAQAFRSTPYVVSASDSAIVVTADVAHARWQHLASMRGLSRLFTVTLIRSGSARVKQVEASRAVNWQAGFPRIGRGVSMQSGKQWSYQRGVEHGLGLDGLTPEVDYHFSSREVTGPIAEVLRRAGWRTALVAEAKGALVIAALGASSIIIVPIGLLLSSR